MERKFRETSLFQVAPVNNNMIKAFVARKVLGLPGPTDRAGAALPHAGGSEADPQYTGSGLADLHDTMGR